MYPQSSMCLHTVCATMPLISPFLMERKLVAIINVYGKKHVSVVYKQYILLTLMVTILKNAGGFAF